MRAISKHVAVGESSDNAAMRQADISLLFSLYSLSCTGCCTLLLSPPSLPIISSCGRVSVATLYFTMAEAVRQRITGVKQELRRKSKVEGWILPKQESSWAPPGTWTNLDLDVTPLARRTWTSLTILGYWISDIISIQSWETGSTILAVGLTW